MTSHDLRTHATRAKVKQASGGYVRLDLDSTLGGQTTSVSVTLNDEQALQLAHALESALADQLLAPAFANPLRPDAV